MLLVDEKTRLYRGPRPTDLSPLRDAGIRRIISLESGIYDVFHDGQLIERQFPCEFGMDQYDMKSSLGVSAGFRSPEVWAVERFLALMEPQYALPTYLHCLSGVDRTGFFCAVYRMQVQGWGFEPARREWINLGRHPWYVFWESALRKWERA